MIFSFKFLFVLNNTMSATPLPVRSPDKRDAKSIILLKYNCVIITLDAQFGNSPTRLEINGENILPFKKIFDILSSPNKYITEFKINVIININIIIFTVCFIADIKILSFSQ